MVIEILYPDVCCMYSDPVNVEYLRACLPDAEIINTGINSVPYFADHKPDFIYMGSLSETSQPLVISQLLPYAGRIKELMEQDVTALITGNAIDIFGKSITRNSETFNGLGVFDFTVWQDMDNRHNSIFVGKYEDIDIVGYKSTFSQITYHSQQPLFKLVKGAEKQDDGIHVHNFMLSSLIGPLLVMNPLFTRKLFSQMHLSPSLAFEEELMQSYEYRLKQLTNPAAHINLGAHGV